MSEIAQLTEVLDKKFTQLDQNFSKIDKKFTQIDHNFSEIDKKFTQIDNNFAKVDKKFDDLTALLSNFANEVHARFDQQDARFDRIE